MPTPQNSDTTACLHAADQSEGDNPYRTDYRLGRDNVAVFGFDVHNPVFFLSAASLLPFIAVTLAFPETMSTALADAKTWVVSYFDGFFVITINLVTLFCIALALSPLGKIRLGGAAAKPEFGVLSWLAMLFSAGVGTGMVFWGTAEPAAYYTNWSGTPFNVDALTPEAERLAYSATIFHWGVAPWSIYAIVGLALAFFTFNKGLPLTIRSTFYPLIGDRVWGWLGHVIDLTAVIATVFGLATTLGFGATLAASGLHFIFDTPNTLTTRIAIIVLVTAIAIYSVILGLERGVKRLSNLNIIIAAAFFAFAVIVGPTRDILANWVTSARDYVADTPRLSNWIGREDQTWFHDWTILYWAWWISWSPFVGMFIARVSKGRTIRQFLAAVIGIPVMIGVLWFSTFGKLAIDQIQTGVGALATGGTTESSLVLFQTLENLPFPKIASGVALFLLLVFFVTSSDSGSLVVDSITAGGKLDAPTPQRVFWASVEGLVAIALLAGGGATALASLQNGVIAAGLPFTCVLLVCCVSLTRGLIEEHRVEKEVKTAAY